MDDFRTIDPVVGHEALDTPDIASRLERGRTELLDISTRNRLIHTPRGSKTARTIEVTDELSAEVYRLLVKEGRIFTFAPGRQSRAADEALEADEAFVPLAQPEDEEFDERGIAQRHSDTKLQTQLTSEGLQKRLLSLYYDARTLQEEQGVNILYLALGMLKWFDAPNSDVERCAPLILVPVALDRGSAGERFKLRWLQEDAAPNLSLIAMLKSQHGLVLPEFEDEELDPAAYMVEVAATIAPKDRWEVRPNDIVLGLFSFAKFLMYRDLDPANWPADAALDKHPLVAGLLGDGFDGGDSPIGDDEPIDLHIGPANMVHIVDADSSQTLAIEEARSGRDLVIQGPPGTGKSQTIANVIAAAVADGKRVLFVAEKMAALEVVKRRLDSVGVGDICLELHSNKANKRLVLQELKRTWDLGRPHGAADRSLVAKLETHRDWLNQHPARLHRRHEPSGLSAYHVIGHLVRLQRAGVAPSEIILGGPEQWSRDDKRQHEQVLRDLAGRIAEMGLPETHPWRGVGLDVILKTELDRLMPRIRDLRARLGMLIEDRNRLQAILGRSEPDTAGGIDRLALMGREVAATPDLDPSAITDDTWTSRTDDIADLIEAGATYAQARTAIGGTVAEVAWSTDVGMTRQHMAAYGDSWLRWLKGDWRRANAQLKAILSAPPPKTLAERLRLLDQLITAQKAAAELVRDESIGRQAFGAKWRREKSDWPGIRRIFDWVKRHRDLDLGDDFRQIAVSVADKAAAGQLASTLADSAPKLLADLDRLFHDLKLDLATAFGASGVEAIEFGELAGRLDLWLERSEELSKWIAFRVRAEKAAENGLGGLVACLADGRLDGASVIDAFEMAYYEALLGTLVAADPEIGRFDGEAQHRLVHEFRDLDLRRIEFARLEVAAAHHQRMPKVDGGAGPLGVLKGEMARKRGHLPIRQLMKRAGPAIQALKPVFMMSPLSVAQFLEPGVLTFDLLVIDEASQIQPVDALGAIARCRQMVVVGDDRQLPPTRFFAKMMGADDDADDDDGVAGVGDIESILGLCTAKGVPQRMLRWHYRSRHQSLIAVSNSQFYDNRLYIVPSPYTNEAGMGLRFNHLPNGVFDSGNTGINAVEAKAVAEAIVRHARAHPELSLGVATFSVKQRRAVLDELERLRRLNPETEEFFAAHPAEPFFVKNLENVQGDERDVIFISVGYGRNAQGYMAMRFGPLSAEGGERRLNVLISRAKRRCEVFSSITDEDIDLERGKGKGVFAFKLFLHFARTGRMSFGTPTDREHDSVFEEQVAAALKAEGYDVHAQVGLAGFFIDLAVADFDRPGRYVLGIECDGASYHNSRSARDRDRLRQAVLEDHGWIIHRIWSTDWFQRPEEQLRKVVAAIEAAKAELDARLERVADRHRRAVPIEIVTIDRADVTEIGLEIDSVSPVTAYQEASITALNGVELHEVPAGTMAGLVKQVVEVEGPVHEAEIVTRIRTAWGLQRAGGRIQEAVGRGIAAAVRSDQIVRDGSFYSIADRPVLVRDRVDAASASLRKPDMLPPAELKAAALAFVRANYGATADEIVLGVSRQLGFKATSAQLRAVIEAAVETLVAAGDLECREGVLAETAS